MIALPKHKMTADEFLAWAEAPSTLTSIRWAWPIAHVLPVLTITAGLLSANEVISVQDGHTGEEVIVAASGPGSDKVRGFLPNTRIFDIVMAALGFKPGS